MRLPTLVLLPGLDGTGLCFAPLVAELDPPPTVVRYPDAPLDFDACVAHVRAGLPRGPFLLVGESFSGPVAIRLAAERPEGCVGLVLVATFARNPVPLPAWLVQMAAPGLFAVSPPPFAVRAFLTGPDATDGLVGLVRSSIAGVSRSVLRQRLTLVSGVDVTDDLARVDVPILYLQALRDRLVRPTSLVEIRRVRPDIAVETLDCAHLVLQCRPVEALERIRAWWSSDETRDPVAQVGGVEVQEEPDR
ncbi:MAG: hypothetical protein H6737_27100 [Alphaproteobacteria bacterium]|nr:hypothetical protein [Alphaproteobacteria bacterium]